MPESLFTPGSIAVIGASQDPKKAGHAVLNNLIPFKFIGTAQAEGVPIISVHDGAFATIEKIEVSTGKTHIREKRKVERVKELMDPMFDLKRFLKNVR